MEREHLQNPDVNRSHEPRQLAGRGVLTASRPGGLGTARPTLRFMERQRLWMFIGLSFAASAWGQGIFTLQVGGPAAPTTPPVSHRHLWRIHKATETPH